MGAGAMVNSWNIVFAIIIYGVVGLVYNLIMMMVTKTFDWSWSLIPYYGLIHLLINSQQVFNFSADSIKEVYHNATNKV